MAVIRRLLVWLHILKKEKLLMPFKVSSLPITYSSLPKPLAKKCIINNAKKSLRNFRDYKKGGRL